MTYSNAQILAAVVSHWARPAVTQIAVSKMASLPMVQAIQQSIVGSGLVNSTYNIANDLLPLVTPAVNNVLQPYLEQQFAKIPDEAIPNLARDVIAEAEKQGSYSLMDGVLVLDAEDIEELKQLIEKNLPKGKPIGYEVKI